jgi:O-antigen/teichoic acid export membrane protein
MRRPGASGGVLESAKAANILAFRMRSTLLWRRGATAAGIYGAAAFGILGTIVSLKELTPKEFGVLTLVISATGFFQTLFDLTIEEALVKFGFRYSAQQRFGRLRRMFRIAVAVKLAGGLVAAVVLVALAPLAHLFWKGSTALPFLIGAAIPFVQAPEGVAGAALMLRSRYDIRGAFLLFSMVLRFSGLAVGAHYGVWQAVLGVLIAQVLATAAVSTAGLLALRRFAGDEEELLAEDRPEIRTFVIQSSLASGVVSVRALISPLLLGAVSTIQQVALFKAAQSPQGAFASLSAPARMVLLAEQTKDWEHGRREQVFRGVRTYTLVALGAMLVIVPPFWLAMHWIVVHVGKPAYAPATDAARLILLAAALQLVVGWAKSFPVTIGRPELRVLAHGIESAALVPLVIVFGSLWGATGAGGAVLASSCVFAAVWGVLFARLKRGEIGRGEPAIELERHEAGEVLGL